MIKRLWICLWLAATLAAGALGAPAPAGACSYSLPPWYSTAASLDIPPLPAGVVLDKVAGSDGGKFRLSNTSSIPIYGIGKFATGADEFAVIGPTFPDRFGPTMKVVDGQAWDWKPHYTGEKVWTWQPAGDAIELLIGGEAISMPNSYVAYFTNEIGDNRPANAPLPPAERAEIRLVYGAELITIPVTVSYALNPDYEPDAGATATAFCDLSAANNRLFEQRHNRPAWQDLALVGAALLFLLGCVALWRRIPGQE